MHPSTQESELYRRETHPRVSGKTHVLKLPLKFLRWWSLRTTWGRGRQYEYSVTQPRIQ